MSEIDDFRKFFEYLDKLEVASINLRAAIKVSQKQIGECGDEAAYLIAKRAFNARKGSLKELGLFMPVEEEALWDLLLYDTRKKQGV